MRSLEELLDEAATMHRGCVCAGQVLGVRMAMLACRLLGISEPTQTKRLMVFVEVDRCATDAIAAVTGCRLGKRTLKCVDYGKMAATFLDLETGRAIRVVALESSRRLAPFYAPGLPPHAAQREAYKVMPDEELFTWQDVLVVVPEEDMPGRPVSRVVCDRCGEAVTGCREVRVNGQVLCRACAYGAYYVPCPPVRATGPRVAARELGAAG